MAESSKLKATGTAAPPIVVLAGKSVQSLSSTIQRFKRRNKTLNNLHAEVENLSAALDLLRAYTAVDPASFELLHGPIQRCSQVCDEFRSSMEQFHATSKGELLDWGKMEFLKGSISDFIENLAGYRSTIFVVFGSMNFQKPSFSKKSIDDYREMVQDTVNGLKIHVQRINETIASIGREIRTSKMMVDLNNEKSIAEQCIRICLNAKSHVEALARGNASSQKNQPATPPMEYGTFDGNLDKSSEIISRLQSHLMSFLSNDGPDRDRERLKFQQDVEISKQYLGVCKLAAEAIPRPKVFKVVEAIVEAESDQVIVTTLADQFDVLKALSSGHSTQLIGSMTSESLQQLSQSRYASKFGTVTFSTLDASPTGDRYMHQAGKSKGPVNLEASQRKPAPNEMRRRMAEGGK